MSVASYLLFSILGFLTMLLAHGLETVTLPSDNHAELVSWLFIDGLWLTLIAIGLYQWCKGKSHKH